MLEQQHAPDPARRNETRIGDNSLQLARPPLKVFLVEDSVSVRDRLIELLADPGNVEIVGYAESQDASLAKMRNGTVDVAIVDLNLKGGSGFGVIEAVRAQSPKAPPTIVVLTNYAFPEYEVACRQRGADFFFDKSTQFGAVKQLLSVLRERVH
jgi:two-component system OmpR family response regulator